MAVFSLAFPVPPLCLPKQLRDERIIDLQGQWEKGRFPGVSAIEVPTPGAKNGSTMTPKALISGAASWFASPLKESVGAGEDTNHVVRHRDLGDTCALTAKLPTGNTASIRLAATEFLQFRGSRSHTIDGQEIELGTDYLVLHIIVENCSSAMLESISLALHRPNQQPRNLTLAAAPGAAVALPDRPRLLDAFLDTAAKEFTAGVNDDKVPTGADSGASFPVSSGGYLEGRRRAGALHEGPAGFHRIIGSRTIRSVSALPYDGPLGVPTQFQDSDTTGTGCWSPADMWAWSLSAGGDRYAEGTPDPCCSSDTDLLFGNYLHWAMAASPSGIAAVRRSPAGNCDTKPWKLTSTHFLDLMILVHRSREYLQHLSRRLREYTLELPRDVQDIDNPDDASTNLNYLEERAELFGHIQSDLLFLRDHLWFDAVPDHEMGSRVLHAYRTATGVSGRYDDIASEISLRKDVYTTLDQSVRLRLQRLRSELKEKEDTRRAAQDTNRNLMIGACGLAFAIPGVLQMSPWVDTWFGFGLTIAVVGIIVAGMLMVYRRSNTDNT